MWLLRKYNIWLLVSLFYFCQIKIMTLKYMGMNLLMSWISFKIKTEKSKYLYFQTVYFITSPLFTYFVCVD